MLSVRPVDNRTNSGTLQIWSVDPLDPSGRNRCCSTCKTGAPAPHFRVTEISGMPDWFKNVEKGLATSFLHDEFSAPRKWSAVVARQEYCFRYLRTPAWNASGDIQ